MPIRKTLRRFHEPGQLHELTFSCYQRRPLLAIDPAYQTLATAIQQANEEMRFQLIAFVFMPEHVHLLVRPPDIDPAVNTSNEPVPVEGKGIDVDQNEIAEPRTGNSQWHPDARVRTGHAIRASAHTWHE